MLSPPIIHCIVTIPHCAVNVPYIINRLALISAKVKMYFVLVGKKDKQILTPRTVDIASHCKRVTNIKEQKILIQGRIVSLI